MRFAAKAALRAEALARRTLCDPALCTQLTATILRDCPPPKGAIIAGYHPIGTEISVLPVLEILFNRGHTITLPETPAHGNPLIFRAWSPGGPLVHGRLNTLHSTGEILTPDYLLIPLLAFDAACNRLGYGAGYYDRTLAKLPDSFRLGCAFAAQQVPAIPTTPQDAKLHAIATESGIIRP